MTNLAAWQKRPLQARTYSHAVWTQLICLQIFEHLNGKRLDRIHISPWLISKSNNTHLMLLTITSLNIVSEYYPECLENKFCNTWHSFNCNTFFVLKYKCAVQVKIQPTCLLINNQAQAQSTSGFKSTISFNGQTAINKLHSNSR